MTKPPRKFWTPKEDKRMLIRWGVDDLVVIATLLGRTPYGVAHRARVLGLATPNRGTFTLNHIMRVSGHSYSRARSVLRLLHIAPPRAMRMRLEQPERLDQCAFDEEQVDRVLAKLREIPDGELLYRPGKRLSKAGAWGVGRKPKACLRCGSDERPHFARGLDKRCYQAGLRERVGRSDRPRRAA